MALMANRQVPGEARWPNHLYWSCFFHHDDSVPWFKALFRSDLSCDTRPKQPLCVARMNARRSLKPVIVPIVRTSPRMAPLSRGAAAAIFLVTSAAHHPISVFLFLSLSGSSRLIELRLFPFFPCFHASQSDSVYLRIIFGSQTPQGFVFASPAPSSTLPPQLFFTPPPSCDSRLVFPISLLAQTLTSNFHSVNVVPE